MYSAKKFNCRLNNNEMNGYKNTAFQNMTKKTSTAPVDPRHLKVEVAGKIFLTVPMLYIELAVVRC